jgi:hypothetical protein
MGTRTRTIRLPDTVWAQLQDRAQVQDRSVNYLVAQAVASYLTPNQVEPPPLMNSLPVPQSPSYTVQGIAQPPTVDSIPGTATPPAPSLPGYGYSKASQVKHSPAGVRENG